MSTGFFSLGWGQIVAWGNFSVDKEGGQELPFRRPGKTSTLVRHGMRGRQACHSTKQVLNYGNYHPWTLLLVRDPGGQTFEEELVVVASTRQARMTMKMATEWLNCVLISLHPSPYE